MLLNCGSAIGSCVRTANSLSGYLIRTEVRRSHSPRSFYRQVWIRYRQADDHSIYVRWVQRVSMSSAGTIVCSVCAGAFVLGEAGLSGWAHSDDTLDTLRNLHPTVSESSGRYRQIDHQRWRHHHRRWHDGVGLSRTNPIERFISPAIMVATARYFLVDAAGREQRFYSSFSPRMHHGDGAIVKVQRWLQTHQVENLTVRAMASCVRLSERTFLRRFQSAEQASPRRNIYSTCGLIRPVRNLNSRGSLFRKLPGK